ncbi:MAG: hypothetical protein AB7F39_06780 [Variibacter sp.]|jgi:hypothetical protein
MAFAIRRVEDVGTFFLFHATDGELYWTPNKAKAKRFDETEADAIAEEINHYASVPAEVVGISDHA